MKAHAPTDAALSALDGSALFYKISLDGNVRLRNSLCLLQEEYQPNELVHERGRPIERMRLILEKTVCADLFYDQPSKKEKADRFGPGRILGAETVFSSGDSAYWELRAGEEGCSILSFDPRALLEDDSPLELQRQFLENLLRCLSDQTVSMFYWLHVLSQRSLRDKILAFAEIMCSRSGSDTFTLKMTQNQLASYLRVARPSLSRELRMMKEEGVLKVKGKNYTITKAPKTAHSGESDRLAR